MAKTGAVVKLNKDKLRQLERESPGRAGKVIQKVAQDCETYIKTHMSSQSPSPKGQPPGVDTGALVNSIIVEPQGRDTWILHDGVEYGVFLEYGTVKMAARPFFLPAIEYIVTTIPDELLESVVK